MAFQLLMHVSFQPALFFLCGRDTLAQYTNLLTKCLTVEVVESDAHSSSQTLNTTQNQKYWNNYIIASALVIFNINIEADCLLINQEIII